MAGEGVMSDYGYPLTDSLSPEGLSSIVHAADRDRFLADVKRALDGEEIDFASQPGFCSDCLPMVQSYVKKNRHPEAAWRAKMKKAGFSVD